MLFLIFDSTLSNILDVGKERGYFGMSFFIISNIFVLSTFLCILFRVSLEADLFKLVFLSSALLADNFGI